MGRKLSFPYVDIWSDVPKGKFVMKNNRILVVFPPIFVANTKIIHDYNFVAPLNQILMKEQCRVTLLKKYVD